MMADNYKILAQTTAASIEPNTGFNQANVVYTVPENTQAAISSVSLINSSIISEEYSLGVVKSEESAPSVQTYDSSFYENRYLGWSYNYLIPQNAQRASYEAYSSTDGLSWSIHSGFNFDPLSGSSSQIQIVSAAGKIFAFDMGGKTYRYSSDGVSWSLPESLPVGVGSPTFTAIREYGQTIVIPGSPNNPGIYSNNSGQSWNLLAAPNSWGASIVYNGQVFLTLNDDVNGRTLVYSSTNLISWSSGIDVAERYYRDLAYGNSVFVILRQNFSLVSTNGISWNQFSVPVPSLNGNQALAFGDNRFVAMGNRNEQAYISTNGITWQTTSVPLPPYSIYRFGYSNGNFFAFGFTKNPNLFSTDGITWTMSSSLSLDGSRIFNFVGYSQLLLGELISYDFYNLSQKNTIIPTRSIEPNTVDEVTGGITLSAGDQIRVYSESDDLIVQVYGVEIS